jgi:hypothetical protein
VDQISEAKIPFRPVHSGVSFASRDATRWRDSDRIDRRYHTPANLFENGPNYIASKPRFHPPGLTGNSAIAADFAQCDDPATLVGKCRDRIYR